MPYEIDRLRPTLAADSDVLVYAALPGAPGGTLLAETRVEPISVPRPQAFDTVTIGVVTGRPLKLEFTVGDVKTREVARDDLILGFENGGKVVLKDYMHAFGLLGDQRTTIIQPDGKHYAFTELLAPTAGAKPEAPAPGAGHVFVVDKPAPGETQRFKLSAEKPTALNFGKSDVAAAEVDKAGDLIVTFKDRAVLVLEGYAALKGSADIALHFTKGDKMALDHLAPGAAPEGADVEGGHLFTPFDPEQSPGPFDHLGALGPEPVSLIAPPGPPDSPPPVALPPPETLPPRVPPPESLPPDAARDAGARPGAEDAEGDAAGLSLIVAADMDIGGDVETETGRWGESAAGHGGQADAPDADAAQRGWIDGHDGPAQAAAPMQATALHAAALAAAPGDAGPAMSAEPATLGAGAPEGGASMSSRDVFDSGDAAPDAAPARADAGAGAFAAAFNFAAAHAETPAPQVQNPAQHNVMGHG